MENLKLQVPNSMAEVEAMADELRERNKEWRSFEAADMLNRFDQDLKPTVMLAGLAIAILLYEGKTKGNLNGIEEGLAKLGFRPDGSFNDPDGDSKPGAA